jgi:hypothetical protein
MFLRLDLEEFIGLAGERNREQGLEALVTVRDLRS